MNEDDDPHLVETAIASDVVFAGKLLEVRSDRVRLPDGVEATREFVVHPGAVLVVPVLADGRLVLERQFRYPVRRVMLEFPAGKIDAGETPLETARRELVEEVGYTATLVAAARHDPSGGRLLDGIHRPVRGHRAHACRRSASTKANSWKSSR